MIYIRVYDENEFSRAKEILEGMGIEEISKPARFGQRLCPRDPQATLFFYMEKSERRICVGYYSGSLTEGILFFSLEYAITFLKLNGV